MTDYNAEDSPIRPVSSDQDPTISPETQAQPLPSSPIPTRIGPYHVKRVIASGAMGIVYEAAQDKPRRTVAVKVMRPGIVSRSALRRFDYESQYLARLQHRGIAQVYEAGTHDDGSGSGPLPYFAMEYIPGAKRITDFVWEKKLPTRQRLELFCDLCDALEYGHQKGIIHRDLKPANILIDSHGQVKIIDFGVARSTDADLAMTTLQTNVGQLIGTLQYMSPEQCEADPNDLDARSDVYGLGVVLYELLCERLPYNLTGMVITVATQVIRQFSPPKPGTVVHALRGDVETIMLKALEKERDRRYRSAGDLGDDIRRYLSSEAIIARPPSISYQLRVFARRNKAVFASLAAVFLVLVAGIIVSSNMYVQAKASRDAAEKVTSFWEDTLASVSPFEAQGPSVTVMDLLDRTSDRIGPAFRNQPLVEARLRRTMGNVYAALGNYRAAEPHLQTALDIRRRRLPPESREVADSLIDYALWLRDAGQSSAAEPLCREALAVHRKLLGNEHPDVAKSANALGVVLYDLKRYAAAESLLREALAIRRKVFGNEHGDVAQTLDNLAETLRVQRRYDAAEPLLNEALAIRRKVFGSEHLEVAFSLNNMGFFLKSKGEFALAAETYRQALEIAQRTGNGEQRLGAVLLVNLAAALRASGNDAEAEPLLREALRVQRKILAGENQDVVACLKSLAEIRKDNGDFAGADSFYREALAIRRKLHPEGHVEIAGGLNDLATTLLDRGDFASAVPLFREALNLQRKALGAEDPESANTLANLGAALSELGETAEAENLLREAVERFRAAHGENHWHTGVAQSHLGDCLRRQERYEEAERELLSAYHVLEAAWKPHDPRTIKTVERLIALYEAWNAADPTADRAEKAAEWKTRLAPKQ